MSLSCSYLDLVVTPSWKKQKKTEPGQLVIL
jgi:hypothetical protein